MLAAKKTLKSEMENVWIRDCRQDLRFFGQQHEGYAKNANGVHSISVPFHFMLYSYSLDSTMGAVCKNYKLPTAIMVVTWITVGRWPIISWWVLSFDLWFLSFAGEQQQQIGLDLAPTATQEDMPADTQKANLGEKNNSAWWPERWSKHTWEIHPTEFRYQK